MTEQTLPAAPAAVAGATAQGQRDLGQLRGLARARLAADDEHLVRGEQARDLVTPRADGQRLGKLDSWDGMRGAGRHGRRIIRAAQDGAGLSRAPACRR